MCGRTCLTLAPDEICLACGKAGGDGKKQKLNWRNEYNLGRKYEGHVDGKGYNTAPQDITPVLVSGTKFDETDSSPIIVPMLWGLIPRWHKGDYKKHGLTTNNCRLEGLRDSKLYQPLLKAGNRCVVLCEGFYEWQTITGAKSSDRKVYYIYFPQAEGIKMEDKSTWPAAENVKLFKVAGLYDKWTNESGDTMYSYTIITFESNEKLAWLHHRTPAVLETDEQVEDWLDMKRVTAEDALKLLTQPTDMVWHQVSNYVNSSRNKSEQCNKVLSEVKTPKSKMMQMWLKKSNEPKDEEVKGEKRSQEELGNECKKVKK